MGAVTFDLVVPFETAAGISLGDLVVPVHVHGDDFSDTPEIRMRLGVEAYGARLNVLADIPTGWIDAGQLRTEPVVLPGDGPRLVSAEWADEG